MTPEDPIVAEVRRIRHEIAKRFDFDIERIAKAAMAREQARAEKVVQPPVRKQPASGS